MSVVVLALFACNKGLAPQPDEVALDALTETEPRATVNPSGETPSAGAVDHRICGLNGDAARAVARLLDAGLIEILDVSASDIVGADQGVIAADLIGYSFQDDPPQLQEPAWTDIGNMGDGGVAPYVVEGLEPFSLEHFVSELNYGGWHTWNLAEYGALHGFSTVSTYNATAEEWAAHFPEETTFLRWGGVAWDDVFADLGIDEGRYDGLADHDAFAEIHDTIGKASGDYRQRMLDIEDPVLSPDSLASQSWFPLSASAAEQQAFEDRYYDGYAEYYAAPADAARAQGWTDVSIYGWSPVIRTWWGLSDLEPDLSADWRWEAYGQRIFEAYDIINTSLYAFYWSEQNVAYTLANMDLNVQAVKNAGLEARFRPYTWVRAHGGGGGWRWWAGQPLTDEEVRAWTTLLHFTGIEGLVHWDWSGTGNPNVTTATEGADVMIGTGFSLTSDDGSTAYDFDRYQVIHILDVTDDIATFQPILGGSDPYGIEDENPTYSMEVTALEAQLRADTEPMGAMFEGLALVKALEPLLAHGEIHYDQDARVAFDETLPLVRRVSLGDLHVVGTYDPAVVHGGEPREVAVPDLAGREISFAADEQVRLYALCAQ